MRKFFLPFLFLLAFSLSSCEDEVSTIGAPFFNDTISIVTSRDTITPATPGVALSSYSLPVVPTASGINLNGTVGSTTLFIGKAEANAVESWAALKFPVLQSDTLDDVTSVRLLFRVIPFKHGEQTTQTDFTVRIEEGGKVTESMESLELSEISAESYGAFQGDMTDTSLHQVAIPLNQSILTHLGAGSLAFVLVPGTMTTVRAFGSSEVSDARFHPMLEYTYTSGAETKITYRKPTLDLSIVKRQRTATADQLFIAGCTNDRLSMAMHPDSLGIDPAASVNNATLRLTLDPTQSSLGANLRDTLPPAIVLKGMAAQGDTLSTLIAYGTKSTDSPNVYEFQLRDVIEYWLANPTENFGLELRSGYLARSVGSNLIYTEDFTLNRWTFYGPASTAGLRPELVITSSVLK